MIGTKYIPTSVRGQDKKPTGANVNTRCSKTDNIFSLARNRI